ncbi:SdpA family antimicrobial peptide system protein [Streptomyces sp. AV19]|uniref:SdpA family antimicrobial peptide system protein n=1 Tax=Streptomyces sp. AV19 TaxID=2793068 RepID=UPI0018FE8562|nr:SdpA family antimicrobial peptide system protein [Streptomyces sp. AV19]MBH1933016.1 SdpA family antimicrobial peptide system protein [Streptomyces sp. AV19]MDG4531729.1 SdpA family antimicrobial peptide system protein [Streptomyces sp. AV19]
MRFFQFEIRCDTKAAATDVPRSWTRVAAAAWVVVILYVAQSFLPSNAVTLPGQDSVKKPASAVVPQGWAFFTKSAKDPTYAPYREVDGHWKSIALTPHSRPSNLFGFDRASRTQGVEVALMLRQKETRWTDCDSADSPTECLERVKSRMKTTNPSPSPSLCGRAAVVEMKPIPWAWRDLSEEKATPTRVASWEVECR